MSSTSALTSEQRSDAGSKALGAESLAAFIATAIGIVAALSFSAISWYASLIPAGVSYYLLMKYWAPCQRFSQ